MKIVQVKTKKILADEVKGDDIFVHPEHGLLAVQSIEYADGKKVAFTCVKREKGANKDAEVMLFREDIDLVTDKARLHIKVHLEEREAVVMESTVNINHKITDFIENLQKVTNTGFQGFANGNQLDLKKTFADHDLIDGSRMLLFAVKGAVSRPEGIRKWTPYPKWELEDLIHSTEHALCYIPQTDLSIVGWSCFKIYHSDATNHYCTTYWKVYDSTNT